MANDLFGLTAWNADSGIEPAPAICICSTTVSGQASDDGIGVQLYAEDTDTGLVLRGVEVIDGDTVTARYGWLPAAVLDEAEPPC